MSADTFVAPEMIVEARALANAVLSLPQPDISKMPRTERVIRAWTEYRRQMCALRMLNLGRWNLDKPEIAAPKRKSTRSRT